MWGSTGAEEIKTEKFPNVHTRAGCGFLSVTKCGFVSFTGVKELDPVYRKVLRKMEKNFKKIQVLEQNESISGIYEENGMPDDILQTLQDLEIDNEEEGATHCIVNVHTTGMYHEISAAMTRLCSSRIAELRPEASVNTRYKTVAKKVKPVATQLPFDTDEHIRQAEKEPSLRAARRIGHKFTKETLANLKIGGDEFLTEPEKKKFQDMLSMHGKAFASSPDEIGCVQPSIVAPMVIFTVPHIPWDLKPIPVPRALLPKLVELLKEKTRMGILEPSMAPYSNRWFTVPKKSGALRFIQDMQPANKVTIRNKGSGPIVDEVAEAFAGHAIYSIGDLYSGYDQFQLAAQSRDLTTMKTPLGLMRMCTLPQGATNSVAHMQSAMNQILRDFVPEKTIPFVDDIPIKGCEVKERDLTVQEDGCRAFVSNHIEDVTKILSRLEEVNITLSIEKSKFGVDEILVVGHLCGSYGRKPNPEKVDAIGRMKACSSVTEVRRFLGACVFYQIWIPHFAHISEPLYKLLRKRNKFVWQHEQDRAMIELKRLLESPSVLKQVNYGCGRPVIVTVDTSPIAIGWAIGQDDEEGKRFAIRFGARILTERQRAYPQVKRELWGALTALKADRNYLIGAEVVLETDCLPLLGMIANCSSPDIAMLRWIAYIKSLNPILVHIEGKKNSVADMLSRARYFNEEEMMAHGDGEELLHGGYVMSIDGESSSSTALPFKAELYEGKLRDIGLYLSTLERQRNWMDKTFKDIRHQSYGYLLRDGFLWKRAKRAGEMPLRVVGDSKTKAQVLEEFHDTLWAGHRGIWATYTKIKERYWWKGLYKDVEEFVASCVVCQLQSKVRHRDELHPTYPIAIHFQWMIDLVAMPNAMWGMKYLVLAREELSNFVEGRALRTKTTENVCRFILEDIFSRYGSIGRMRADRGELNAIEAEEFFKRYGVQLKLTTAYNPEANGKIERGHPPIIHALVKACRGKPSLWPKLLPFALWADRTTHSSVTGYMPVELMYGQKPIMPAEEDVPTWVFLSWEDGISTERLLELRIQQLQRLPEDLAIALEKMKAARLGNKERFDRTHRLRRKKIREGDWVLVFDSTLEHQHSTVRKFAKRWIGPYVVTKVHLNGTYVLRELDGVSLRVPVAGKRIKVFRRSGKFHLEDIEEIFHPQELEGDQQLEESEEALEDAVDDTQNNEGD
jgi:Integrase zinc binding domain/RNase H-like domain found in reverse transcriptase/Reverse transcriptase (RNA-dependent DNA polymerase)